MSRNPSVDFQIYRGNTANIEGVVKFNGTVFDLTGVSMFFSVKKDPDDTALVIQVTSAGSLTYPDAVNGKYKIALSNSDTDIAFGNYHYDLVLKTLTNEVVTIRRGIFQIYRAITDPSTTA